MESKTEQEDNGFSTYPGATWLALAENTLIPLSLSQGFTESIGQPYLLGRRGPGGVWL